MKNINTIKTAIAILSLAAITTLSLAKDEGESQILDPIVDFDYNSYYLDVSMIDDFGLTEYGAGLALGYYIFPHISTDIGYFWAQETNNVEFNLKYYFRHLNKVSPYFLGGADYRFSDDGGFHRDDYGLHAGLGIEFDIKDDISLFTEGKHTFFLEDQDEDEASVRAGFRFKF